MRSSRTQAVLWKFQNKLRVAPEGAASNAQHYPDVRPKMVLHGGNLHKMREIRNLPNLEFYARENRRLLEPHAWKPQQALELSLNKPISIQRRKDAEQPAATAARAVAQHL